MSVANVTLDTTVGRISCQPPGPYIFLFCSVYADSTVVRFQVHVPVKRDTIKRIDYSRSHLWIAQL